MSDVTHLLEAAVAGDARAAADLLPLVYQELRALAAVRLSGERAGHTLDATALVHEAYLRLVASPERQRGLEWNGCGHFFGAAAEAMRRILIDHARQRATRKRGGGRERVDLDDVHLPAADERADELLALDEALTALARVEPAKAELVKLRYFAGLTLEEAAACLGISPATANRQWAVARAWLFAALSDRPGPAADS